MLLTRSGIEFDVTNPDPDKINIFDISHALGLECRYGNHCNYPYSVAEHSFHLSMLPVDRVDQKILLLHDATEAYLGDIPCDIKALPEMEGYRKLEDLLYKVIMRKFGLPEIFPEHLVEMDHNIRVNEVEVFFDSIPFDWQRRLDKLTRIPGLQIQCWDHVTAEEVFMERFEELFG